MKLVQELLRQTEKIDFHFPNSFEELMNADYYDYDKFEWFLYYVFKMDGARVEKVGRKGRGDGGADLILNIPQENGSVQRIGVQAKYWKNRVGTEPINQLASAKARHNLTSLWIITTSDLTSDAKEIAESMDIKILRQEDVTRFIASVKERYKKDIEQSGQSSIEFLKSDLKSKKIKIDKQRTPNKDKEALIKKMKVLRFEISKKYNLTPVYTVFNNDTLEQIIDQKPKNTKELEKISGFGPKKIKLFGKEIIEFVNKNMITTKKSKPLSKEQKDFLDMLMKQRVKIAKFNKMSQEDVYDYKTAVNIVKMKPKDIKTLLKVYGFKKENAKIFGDYLTKSINDFLSKK